MQNISDESQLNIDSRKFYIQSYEFIMLGYLIDEEEFQVKPAIQRMAQVFEIDGSNLGRRREVWPKSPQSFPSELLFVVGNTTLTDKIYFTADMKIINLTNVDSYDVYINGDFYGTNVPLIQVTNQDILEVIVVKLDNTKDAVIGLENSLF
jgi:hypothetical protein